MCVGGSVDRVDHGEESGTPVAGRPGLLREHGQARSVQNGESGTVGGQVEAVLPRLPSARPPVLELVERATHGADRLVEHFQEANVVHGGGTLPSGYRPSPPCHLAASLFVAIRLSQLWLPLTSLAMSPT